ncbi:thioredoxin family protein [Candidatus Micrarchaeota archaeon]|nr:thioredoxin family protein [Candidatus Micrarchaeota archaeon]
MGNAIAIAATAIFAALLLLGCAGSQQGPGNAAANTNPGGQQDRFAPPDTHPPKPPGTANLSFSRNASDVMNTETKPFTPPNFDFTNTTTQDGRLVVNYFYSPHCSACIALRPDMDRLEARYGSVEWREFDITAQNGTWAYQQFARDLNLSQAQRLVPQVLVNGTVITDRFNINGSLEGIIVAFSANQSGA